jgi:predicted nucleotidyltransferase
MISPPSQVAAAYAKDPRVTAVAISGSQTSGQSSLSSDVDLYVYVTEPLPPEVRRSIPRGSIVEFDNRFFEPGDEWIDETGLRFDVMFRDIRWIEEQLDRVLTRYEASVGYSTAFWHNMRSSVVLFDRIGWLAQQIHRAQGAYPERLRHAIVAKNHPLLSANLSSYLYQLERAIERGDIVSANHRTTAFLASLFDILFATNRTPHPGEKRLLTSARDLCPLRPMHLEEDIGAMIQSAAQCSNEAIGHGKRLVAEIDQILVQENLLPAGHGPGMMSRPK